MPNAEYGWNWFVHKTFFPQTRNKRTRIIRLCDTCRQSWSFYDLTVGFVQDVQRQKLPSPEKSLRSRFSRRCRCLSSSEVLHFALTIISSSRSRSICFVKRDYWRVRLCLKLTTPSVCEPFLFDFCKIFSLLVFVGNLKLQCLESSTHVIDDSCCFLFCLLCCDRVSLMVACCCS